MNTKVKDTLAKDGINVLDDEKKRKKATTETNIVVTGNDNQIAVSDGNVLQKQTYRLSGGKCTFEDVWSWITLLAVGLLTAEACYAFAVLIGR